MSGPAAHGAPEATAHRVGRCIGAALQAVLLGVVLAFALAQLAAVQQGARAFQYQGW